MKLQKGTLVKIYFKNETVVEGYIYSWDDKECVLENGKGGLLIINNPADNIMMTQVFIDEPETEIDNSPPKRRTVEVVPNEVQEGRYGLPNFTKRGPFVRPTAKTR